MNVYLVGAKNPETKRQLDAQVRANPNFVPKGFVDNDPAKRGAIFLGLPVLGGFEVVPDILKRDSDAYFVNLITGSTLARYETSRELADLGCRFTNLIHPSVDLTDVEMGVGNYLQEVVVQAGAKIGDNSSIHVGAVIAHESIIGDSVFIAHKVSISGEVQVGAGTFMGTNAAVVPRTAIGRWVTVGAGTVVIRDVPDYTTVVGNPAREVRVATGLPDSAAIRPRSGK